MKRPLLMEELNFSLVAHPKRDKRSVTMTQSKPSLWWRRPQSSSCYLVALAILSTIQLLPLLSNRPTAMVFCQDFEDLTNNNHRQNNHQLSGQHNTFQPSSRQSQQHQLQQAIQNAPPTNNNKYSNIIRPILSNRFVSNPAGNNQQLQAQASSSSSVYSGPPTANSIAVSSPLAAPNQAQVAAQQQQASGVSNIELLMKNALARTAQMNSATAEPRQDTAASSVSLSASLPPEVAQSNGPISRQRGEQQQQVAAASAIAQSGGVPADRALAASADKQAESSETNSAETAQTSAADIEADRTTVAQTIAPNVHDTVYTDQRFANLFARRGNTGKKRITPMEQVKAKPTLPSFIKSLPDPKQFTAVQVQEKPVTQSSFASQRLQQQNLQGRLAQQQGSAQKKAVITSNSAAIANNKKTNSLNGKPTASLAASATGPKPIASSASANLKANLASANSKPSVAPSSNNPFNRSQNNNNSDPANVIAMARKRLLANSALESAKLKQQQQNKPST